MRADPHPHVKAIVLEGQASRGILPMGRSSMAGRTTFREVEAVFHAVQAIVREELP